MSCVTAVAGASLVLVVAGVSVSAPPQKAGLNAAPAKLTISAPANVVADLQRPMISSIAWSRYTGRAPVLQTGLHGGRLRAGLLFVNHTCRRVVARKRILPPLTPFAAVMPSAKLVSSAACRAFPAFECCDARADFIQDAIPTVPPLG